ncbi:MAG: Rrf2 family transcriptional regulator [Clostridiales bacterium]|nr:Rrf2 family transcriptional regulator [Clostridiales bacterium]
MKISTKGRYALRMMIDLAQQRGGEYVALKDISERQQISVKYLEQIASLLSKAGQLRSSRGAQGGYQLAFRPEEYTAGEILRITEGSLEPVACLDDAVNQCARCNRCETLSFWEGLAKVIHDYVDGVTLRDLLERASPGDDYVI